LLTVTPSTMKRWLAIIVLACAARRGHDDEPAGGRAANSTIRARQHACAPECGARVYRHPEIGYYGLPNLAAPPALIAQCRTAPLGDGAVKPSSLPRLGREPAPAGGATDPAVVADDNRQ
jgi:hypothetical protein